LIICQITLSSLLFDWVDDVFFLPVFAGVFGERPFI